MKTYVTVNSPEQGTALDLLKQSSEFHKESFVKRQVKLLCGGAGHIITLPVYGKRCTHIEVNPLGRRCSLVAFGFNLFRSQNVCGPRIRMVMSVLL